MWTQPTAHALAGGFAVGLSVGMIIVPAQMIPTLILCCWFRLHVPVAILAVWSSNPLTWVPYLWFEEMFGRWVFRLVGYESYFEDASIPIPAIDMEINPVFVYSGAFLLTVPVALCSYPIGLFFGRLIVARRERRREALLEKARQRTAERIKEKEDGGRP